MLLRTSDGRELSGMIVRESACEIVLRDAANQETSSPVRAVQGRTSVGSMMPAGLIDGLPRDEVLDLLKFLRRGHGPQSVLAHPGSRVPGRGRLTAAMHR